MRQPTDIQVGVRNEQDAAGRSAGSGGEVVDFGSCGCADFERAVDGEAAGEPQRISKDSDFVIIRI
ncbi:MAG: hypothetical protein ACKPHU_15335, partial [Planctomycetaceae bacterium]